MIILTQLQFLNLNNHAPPPFLFCFVLVHKEDFFLSLVFISFYLLSFCKEIQDHFSDNVGLLVTVYSGPKYEHLYFKGKFKFKMFLIFFSQKGTLSKHFISEVSVEVTWEVRTGTSDEAGKLRLVLDSLHLT